MTDQNNKGEALKPIKQWLETLPEPYRSEAVMLAKKEGTLDVYKENLSKALCYGFMWSDSMYEFEEWEGIESRASRGEFDRKEVEG